MKVQKTPFSISLFLIGSAFVLLFFGTFFLFKEPLRATSNPTVDSVVITTTTPQGSVATTIDLNENATKNIYIHGDITDNDGCLDLNANSIRSVFYRSNIEGGTECAANENNCYRMSSGFGTCTISGCTTGAELTVNYECNTSVSHYADPTDTGSYAAENWVGWVEVQDMAGTPATLSSSAEINSLSALDVQGPLNYGTLALSATSTSDSTIQIINTGNTVIDIYLSGTDMTCTNGGVIPVTNERFSLNAGTGFGSMTSLTTSSMPLQLNLAKQSSATLSSTTLYFKLVMPSSGLRGQCAGLVSTIAAIDS